MTIQFDSFEDFLNESEKKPVSKKGQQEKISKVLGEFKKGELKPHNTDKKLEPGDKKDRKQALAIAFSEAGLKAKNKKTVKESLDEWAMGSEVYSNHPESSDFGVKELVTWLNDEYVNCEDDVQCKSDCIVDFIDKIGITLEDFLDQIIDYKPEVDTFSQKLIDDVIDIINNEFDLDSDLNADESFH